MKPVHVLRFSLVLLSAMLLASLAYPLTAGAVDSPPDPLRSVWERAQEIGVYHFSADAEQTLIPRARPSTIGETDERVDLHIEGDVTLPDEARIRLRLEGGGFDSRPVELIQDGTETYLLRDGEQVPIQNPAGLSSPTGDYLGYLVAAENVGLCTEAGEEIPDETDLTCYAYDIDGARFAEHVRRGAEARLSEDGRPLPPGMELSAAPTLQRMKGQGQLWVDEEGLPVRQVVDLRMERVSDTYDAEAHVVVNFQFDGSLAGRGTEPVTGEVAFRPVAAASEPARASTGGSGAGCLFYLAGIGAVVFLARRRRWAYALVAVGLSAIIVLSPVLHVLGIVQFQARQAHAAPAQTFAEAVGLPVRPMEGLEVDPASGAASYDRTAARLSSEVTLAQQSDPAYVCGDGSTTADADGDGLVDADEYCLGTDAEYYDSDRDLITDTLELDGFYSGGKHWVSDPFQPDSNLDGLTDVAEWPEPVGAAPRLAGVADDWDPDADGVPNLWDEDNDGDEVPDNVDLSPFARTGYSKTFSLTTQGSGFDGYQYIEIQVQPEDLGHLRYSTGYLDWPYDEQGQIQDLDDSVEDIRLFPTLRIHTNQAPDRQLARRYDVTVFEEDDGTYTLYAPVTPIGDGGRKVAFHTKIVYGPDEIDDVRWEKVELVWTAQLTQDQEIGGEVRSSVVTIGTQSDSFRVTGLRVTKSRNVRSAILGTPDYPDDDRWVFNLLLGLSNTFLTHQTPPLDGEPGEDTVETRFTSPNTPLDKTWGVTSTLVAVNLPEEPYGHVDEGLSDLPSRIRDFLDVHGYPTDANPSLVVATEEEVGLYGLDDQGVLEAPSTFNLDLDQVAMSTRRSLKNGVYAHDEDEASGPAGWESLDLQSILDLLDERYDDEALAVLLEDLEAEYPDLTEEDLRLVLEMFYTAWFLGQTRMLRLDGQALAAPSRDDAEVSDQLQNNRESLPAYLLEAADLGEVGAGLRIGDDRTQTWQYQREQEEADVELGFLPPEYLTAGRIVLYVGKSVFAMNTMRQALNFAGAVGSFGGRMKIFADNAGQGARKLGFIATVASVAAIWTGFFLGVASTGWDWDSPAVKQMAVYAAILTIISVALFVISLNPVGAVLVGLWSFIDLLVFAITGGGAGLTERLAKALTELFYDVDELTTFEDLAFVDFETDIMDPAVGVVVGNRFRVTDECLGEIERTSAGSNDDLWDSWVTCAFHGSSSGSTAVNQNGGRSCSRSGRTLTCRDPVGVEFRFDQALRNVRLEVASTAEARTFYEECKLWDCDRESVYTDLPDDLDAEDRWEPMTFYLDVLPNDLFQLWSWSEVINPDRDGDGLSNKREATLGTNPDSWDTDLDGLSDQFEHDAQEDLGTDPTRGDTDGDGLPDGLEYRIGTGIDVYDTDGDGLSDGEEVFHDGTGGWTGGWTTLLPVRGHAFVFSNPLVEDADDDGLNDRTERSELISPYGFNDSPELQLTGHPAAESPTGEAAVYVEPQDDVRVALSLENKGPRPVTSTLTLCLPAFLGEIRGGDLKGDSTPPAGPAACNGLEWSFAGGYALLPGASVNTTVTATVSSAVVSTRGEISATLPYAVGEREEEIIDQALVVVDTDDPEVAITAPADGVLLGGGVSQYVIGGSADDESSWVTRVEVDLPAGAGTVEAEGVSPWAHTWDLPADGEYALQARAFDYLGHQGVSASVAVTVDNTAPAVTLNVEDGQIVSGDGRRTITVTLEGDANDNLSGLARVQLSADGNPFREVWAGSGAPSNASWSTDWTLPNEASAQGEHVVRVRAIDRAGNVSDVLERTIIVDVVPPTSGLTDRRFQANPPPHVRTGEEVTLYGVANDAGRAPEPSRPVELVGDLDGLDDATIWLEMSAVTDDDAGITVAWLGDFNGDRLSDAVVGLPGAAEGAGRVTIVYGRAGDWPNPTDAALLADSPTSFVGDTDAGLGTTLAAAGDVNGDGLADLLLGDGANGRVFLVFGSTSPLGRDRVVDGPRYPHWTQILAPDESSIGDWLAGAGDTNGDGLDDVLIGATGAAGSGYLLLGEDDPWLETVRIDERAAVEIGTDPAGARLSGAGDMDGDQYDEFLVASGEAVYLFEGSDGYAAGLGEPNQRLSLADDALAAFESADTRPALAALGDVDGDGLADVAFASGSSRTLVFGDAHRAWRTQSLVFSPAVSGFLAAPGDVDGDGLNDILLGNTAGDADLILGADLSRKQATLTGVQTAASAPHAAGSDLNSDGSSDLLLVAGEAGAAVTAAAYGSPPHVRPDDLPLVQGGGQMGSGILTSFATQANTYTVDDDGGADYTTIQAAVDSAAPGDTIAVEPGVYERFTVTVDHLTVSGVHPDGVFVDADGGPFAVKVEGADGVRLEKMTLRDASSAVLLDHAGVDGYEDGAKKTVLERVLIHGSIGHAVAMDRVSSVKLSRCTLAGTTEHIHLYGPEDAAMEADWSTVSSDAGTETSADGGVFSDDNLVYFVDDSGEIDAYDPAADAWSTVPAPPTAVHAAAASDEDGHLWALRRDPTTGFDGPIYAMAYVSETEIYVGGDFRHVGDTSVPYVARWDGSDWHAVVPSGHAPSEPIYALLVSDGAIYAGGGFGLRHLPAPTEADPYPTWQHWGDISGGGEILVLVLHRSAVLAGGTFGDIGGSTAHKIAKRESDGTWGQIGDPPSDACNGVLSDGRHVSVLLPGDPVAYLAGSFHEVGAEAYGDNACRDPSAYGLAKTDNYWLSGLPVESDLRKGSDIYAIWNYAGGGGWAVGGDFDNVRCYYRDGYYYPGGWWPDSSYCSASGAASNLAIFANQAWQVPDYLRANGPVRTIQVEGEELYVGGDFTRVGGSTPAGHVAFYDGFPDGGGAWRTLGGGVNDSVRALVHDDGRTYVAGAFTQAGGDAAFSFATWDGTQWLGLSEQAFYEYDGVSWQERAVLPGFLGRGASIVSDGDGHLYAAPGSDSPEIYRYTVDTDSWEELSSAPGGLGEGGGLAWTGEHLFALAGGETRQIYRYDPEGDRWETRSPIPATGPVVGAGGDLAFDGRDWLYVLAGANGRDFLRYHVEGDVWESLNDVDAVMNLGGGLARVGQDLYAVPGGDQVLWRYGPVATYPEKLTLEQIALVGPEASVTADWINLPDLVVWPDDFVVGGAGNAWVGGADLVWAPEPVLPRSQLLTYDEARFLDPEHDVYRLTGGSLLDAGYHTYRAKARVGDGEAFTSIQDAIDSGANEVQLGIGTYQEPFHLLSGVRVTGNGAGLTMVEPPAGSTDPSLVRAEGVVGAELSMVTLNGAGQGVDGLLAEDGADGVLLERSIIRGARTAVSTTGGTTAVEVVNNTVVSNTNGLVAADCAPVDVRNTIFAGHGDTGLAYDGCATRKLHKYNLYWDNGADLSPSEPGPGELFADPLFVDPGPPAHDYHTEDGSPVVDAGDPGDPTPPGAGERVDLGYIEQNRAAIYVDDDYCADCLNDGLSWQVDAFRVIQNGLDKADENMRGAMSPGYTVGVAEGVYTETLRVPSYVRLIGAGPEESIIVAGTADSAVTLDGVVQPQVEGFTIRAWPETTAISVTNASNAVTITRSIIETDNVGSHAAIAFSGRATGLVTFNTLIDRSEGGSDDGVLSRGVGTWVEVENNILSGLRHWNTALGCDGFWPGHGYGLHTLSGGQIFNDYNVVNADVPYQDDANTGLTEGSHSVASNPNAPCFEDEAYDDGHYRPAAGSWPIDGASPHADVPPGGGDRADIGYYELTAAPLSIFLGREDVSSALGNAGVQAVEVGWSEVADSARGVTETVPSSWAPVGLETPEETVTFWQTAVSPTQESLYRFYSRASDVAGNSEDEGRYEGDWYEGAFVADGVAPVVTWTLPAAGAVVSSPLQLRAEVYDYAAGAFSVDDVYFEIDGEAIDGEWAAEPWDEESQEPRTFRAWVELGDGYHTGFAGSADLAGNDAQSGQVSFSVSGSRDADTVAPHLQVASPYDGEFFNSTVVFSGTVADAGSGVAAVEVSLDGGYTWQPATVQPAAGSGARDWELTWEAPEDQAFVSYPARVRARDQADNTVEESLAFSIDNVPPVGPEVLDFTAVVGPLEKDAPPGTHFDLPVELRVRWKRPFDGSGHAESLIAVDQFTETAPAGMTNVQAATVLTGALSTPGDWYVHLAVQDQLGNSFARHYGPWHVGTFSDTTKPFTDRLQTIAVDGDLNSLDPQSLVSEVGRTMSPMWREWGAHELLDDVQRSGPNADWWDPQRFFTTWDGTHVYLGWAGAWWTLDGAMWAYLDTGPGGCSQPVTSIGSCPTLPLEADRAVVISGPSTGAFWACSGGSWAEDAGADWSFAQGEGGGTEVAMSWIDLLVGGSWPTSGDALDLGLLAFAVDDGGTPWAVFPATNPLTDICSESYTWNDLYDPAQPTSVTLPTDSQPTGTELMMTLGSPQAPTAARCPGSLLTYELELTNQEVLTVSGLTIGFDGTPGLDLESVEGATYSGSWASVDLPSIAPGAGHAVTLTAVLTDDVCTLAASSAVTLTAELLAEPPVRLDLTHLVDCQPPSLTVTTDPDQTLRPVLGTASDDGTGVSRVDYRVDNGAWTTTDGTLFWSIDLELPPASQWQLDVQAWDQCRAGPVTTLQFSDSEPPTLTVDVGPVVSGDPVDLFGTARDLPYGGEVVAAEVAVDGEWQPATLGAPDVNGVREWHRTWHPPSTEVTYTVQVRAIDAAGNLGTSEPSDVYVRTPLSSDAVTTTVTPEAGGTLVYTDAQGLTTTVRVPPGAVSETLTLVFTPLDEPTHPAAPLTFAGHAFTLELYRGTYLLPGYLFEEAVSIAIAYSETDIADVEDESTLVLATWAGGRWRDAACEPVQRDVDANWLSVPICHLSEFALLGYGDEVPVGGATRPMAPPLGSWARVGVAVIAVVAVLAAAAVLVNRRKGDGTI